MDERDKRRVGEEVEPGGRPKAPGRLDLLQRFVNTWNHELPRDWDRLGTADKARSWLVAKDVVPSGTRINANDAARLREVREALRELAIANSGSAPNPTAVGAIGRASSKATMHVYVAPSGRTALKPESVGIRGVVAIMLGILHEAHITGDWPRLKACRQCGYAFYDRSKNRSAVWCAMSICGNRTKNRTYRRRGKLGGRDAGRR